MTQGQPLVRVWETGPGTCKPFLRQQRWRGISKRPGDSPGSPELWQEGQAREGGASHGHLLVSERTSRRTTLCLLGPGQLDVRVCVWGGGLIKPFISCLGQDSEK